MKAVKFFKKFMVSVSGLGVPVQLYDSFGCLASGVAIAYDLFLCENTLKASSNTQMYN